MYSCCNKTSENADKSQFLALHYFSPIQPPPSSEVITNIGVYDCKTYSRAFHTPMCYETCGIMRDVHIDLSYASAT